MRRLFGWMAGLAGVAALAKWLSTRSRNEPTPVVPAPSDQDPAEALRQKLSDTRTTGSEAAQAAEPATTTPTETQAEPTETLDERRARIHAKAQEAIDAMQEEPPA